MLSYLQALVLGALQGLSELFPVSSLGHSVIIPSLLGWHVDQQNNAFLMFLVATHFATAAVLFAFFQDDWMRILSGLWQSLREREIKTADAKLAWRLVVATVPAGILGLLFEERLKLLLAQARITAAILILNGVMLLVSERLKKWPRAPVAPGQDDAGIARLSWLQTLKVGCLQSIALLPGFSRTGATITGGLLVGLSHEDAAHFSFLLATPIIAAAALLKIPDLLGAGGTIVLGPLAVGMGSAGLAAYFTVRFLTRYFKTKTLLPFAAYCMIAGALTSLILFLQR